MSLLVRFIIKTAMSREDVSAVLEVHGLDQKVEGVRKSK
jgi:hypothetical protein